MLVLTVSGSILKIYSPLVVSAVAIELSRAEEKLRSTAEIQSPAKFFTESKNSGRADRKNGKMKKGHPSGEKGMVRLTINMGKSDSIKPGNIVGAIANTTGIPGSAIGAIDIQQKRTFLDVSEKYAGEVLSSMRNWKIQDKPVMIQTV